MPRSARTVSRGTLVERFWRYVDTSAGLFGCWIWTGARTAAGYGLLGAGSRGAGAVYAHRLSLTIIGREPGAKQLVLHSCDNPPCVNPAHLSAGDHSRNLREAWARGLRAA